MKQSAKIFNYDERGNSYAEDIKIKTPDNKIVTFDKTNPGHLLLLNDSQQIDKL